MPHKKLNRHEISDDLLSRVGKNGRLIPINSVEKEIFAKLKAARKERRERIVCNLRLFDGDSNISVSDHNESEQPTVTEKHGNKIFIAENMHPVRRDTS